jgi:hypothetical protein
MDTNLGSFRNYLAGQRIAEYDPSEAINRAIEQGKQDGSRVSNISRDRENQKWQEMSRQIQLDKITKDQEEGLYFKGKTKVEPLSNNRALFATAQVDKANKLAIALKDNEITYADYRRGMTTLQSQTGQYKAAEKVLLTGAEKYLAGLESGTLSNANNPYYEEFWSAVVNGEADIKWNTDENGEIIMEGNFPTRDGSEAVRVPMSDIDKLPSVLYKPTVSSEDFLESDVKNIYETRSMRAIEKMGPDGIYNMDKIERDEQGIAGGWAREKFGASFEEYTDALGEGDLSKKLTQYITDERFGTEAFREARNTDLAKSFDPTKQTVSSFVNSMAEVDKTKLLDFFKEDWIQVSSGLYDKVEQDKFNAAEKARTKANKDNNGNNTSEDAIIQRLKDINRNASRTLNESYDDNDNLKSQEQDGGNLRASILSGDIKGVDITNKIGKQTKLVKDQDGGPDKEVETTGPIEGMYTVTTDGGILIDISEDELNDPMAFSRAYLASMKLTPTQIQQYMGKLFSSREQFNY